MKSTLKRPLAALAAILTVAWMATTPSMASPPYANYQGTLNDTAGAPLNNAAQAFEFNIYDAATAGTKVWGPFTVVAPVLNGRFNVILGPTDTAARSLDTVFGASDSRFLEIKVGATVIAPRQRFLANPYAYSASSVSNAKIEITPEVVKIKDKSPLEFGSGLGQLAGNATVSAQRQGTAGLEIVGGGIDAASRLTTVYGNLNLVSSGGAAPNLNVGGSAKIAGNVEITGNLKAPTLIDGAGNTINLAELFAQNYPLPKKYGPTIKTDTATWQGIEVDLTPFVADDDSCVVDVQMTHKTVSDMMRETPLLFSFESDQMSNDTLTGLSVAIQGIALAGEVAVIYYHNLDTTAKVYMVQGNSDWFRIYNYKPGFAKGQNNVDSPTYTGADKYKIFVVFHPLITGRVIVRNH